MTFRLNSFEDYPDQEARDRRARFLRAARRAERGERFMLRFRVPLLILVAVLGALALACDRAADPVATPDPFVCETPVPMDTGNEAPSDAVLQMYHALAAGDPTPQAVDGHMPWCLGSWRCTCSAITPGDTTATRRQQYGPIAYQSMHVWTMGGWQGWQY